METFAVAVPVPVRGVVLLIGAAGAGKSTFARRHFASTEILSSDAFRAMVSDDEADQTASAPAFDLLHRALAHRLRRGRLSVVDATNATSGDRRSLLRLATVARRPAVGIVLDPGEASCVARNAGREGRAAVDEGVVRRQWAAVRASLADPARFLGEGFAAIHVLEGAATIDAATIRRDPTLRPAAVTAPAGDVAPPAAPRPTRRRSASRDRRA